MNGEFVALELKQKKRAVGYTYAAEFCCSSCLLHL